MTFRPVARVRATARTRVGDSVAADRDAIAAVPAAMDMVSLRLLEILCLRAMVVRLHGGPVVDPTLRRERPIPSP